MKEVPVNHPSTLDALGRGVIFCLKKSPEGTLNSGEDLRELGGDLTAVEKNFKYIKNISDTKELTDFLIELQSGKKDLRVVITNRSKRERAMDFIKGEQHLEYVNGMIYLDGNYIRNSSKLSELAAQEKCEKAVKEFGELSQENITDLFISAVMKYTSGIN